MKIRFLSIALQEVHDAIDYYEEADSGLFVMKSFARSLNLSVIKIMETLKNE